MRSQIVGLDKYRLPGRKTIGKIKSGSRKKFIEDERRAVKRMKVFKTKGQTKLRQVASDSATQFFMLRHRKVRHQVVDEDQCWQPGGKS